MNVMYPLLIFLFTFGAFGTAINASGLYAHATVNPGSLSTDTNQANSFGTSLQSASSNQASWSWQSIFLLLQVILGGLVALVTLYPLLISYGVPSLWAAALTAPVSIIAVYSIIELVFGRFVE